MKFGHSRRVWAPLNGDDLYLSAHVCWVVSIDRHSGFYVQPRARTHKLDLTKRVQAELRQGAATFLNIAGNHWMRIGRL